MHYDLFNSADNKKIQRIRPHFSKKLESFPIRKDYRLYINIYISGHVLLQDKLLKTCFHAKSMSFASFNARNFTSDKKNKM